MHSVYIHIPFCRQLCSYCDFCKNYYEENIADNYLEALEKEIIHDYNGETIETIYIGGGTPSVLSFKQLEKLLEMVHIFHVSEQLEFTVECNIEDISNELLEFLYQKGVNRLSIGIQSFKNFFLKQLNRNYNRDDIITSLEIVKNSKIKNVNVDFMYALIGQTLDDVKEDIELFLFYDFPHISTYSLILEKHTPLYIDRAKQVSEEIDADMYEYICNRLIKSGYEHYEVSNFSKLGYSSKHNLTYWNNQFYYGFGASASGYREGMRYDHTRSIYTYIENQKKCNIEKIDRKKELQNEFILGFRKMKGIHKKDFFKKYQIKLQHISIIKKLLKQGKLLQNDKYVYINPKYIYTMNEILIEFLDEKEGLVNE